MAGVTVRTVRRSIDMNMHNAPTYFWRGFTFKIVHAENDKRNPIVWVASVGCCFVEGSTVNCQICDALRKRMGKIQHQMARTAGAFYFALESVNASILSSTKALGI
jgi:DNA-binding XRE family transcriptional regulator